MSNILINNMLEHYDTSAQNDNSINHFAHDGDTYEELLELFESIASNSAWSGDAEVREGYSGRGMHGDQCWGIVTSDIASVIETAGGHGLFGAKTDSMGLKSIVYWPRIKFVEA